MDIKPVTLEGDIVRLEPLLHSHHPLLWEMSSDPDYWKWTISNVTSLNDMKSYVETVLRDQERGTALGFVTVERASGKIVGSTRYLNIDMANRKLEIGGTWVARPWQRTAVNTEAKYLLLCHAFEQLGCYRVEFKTDVLNVRSRAALSRIGAKEEGIMRKHLITQTGRVRDSVYFSIIDTEWPDVKRKLEEKLGRTKA